MNSKLQAILSLWLVAAVQALSASSAYSLEASRTYAQYSSLAFCPASCLENWSCQSARDSTLTNVTYIFGATNVACYVGFEPDRNQIVVAFKGSISFDVWFIESERTTVGYSKCENCEVRKDFWLDFKAVQKDLEEKVLLLISKRPTASILVTGHSLGGSVAMVAGLELKERFPSRQVEIHTFGAPRSGNPPYAVYLQSRVDTVYRVVHDHDPAPHYPVGIVLFKHPAREVLFDEGMASYRLCDESGEDYSCSNGYQEYDPEQRLFYFREVERPEC